MGRSSLKNVARLINVANTKVAPEVDFLANLKRSIEMTDEAGKGKPVSQTFKPSSMNCKRGNYYQLMGMTPDVPDSVYTSVGICNAGSDIHIRIQTAIMGMQKNGIDCKWVDVEKFVKQRRLDDLEIKMHTKTETKLYHKKYNLSFMCDGIIEYKGKYYIVEIKSEASSKFYTRDGVDPKHYKQATAYSLSFGIDNVIFIYVSRDNLEMKTFMFNVTDEMRQDLVNYMEEVNGYVEWQRVPPKGSIPRNICQYCGYKDQCRKDG